MDQPGFAATPQAGHASLASKALRARSITGPVVIAVRGPSHSGKTALCERLVEALGARVLLVAWMKRTHHIIDTPGKASDRIWRRSPAVTLLRSDDRLVVSSAPGSTRPDDMLAAAPVAVDVVLLETHEPEPYPTVLSTLIEPAANEAVVARWAFMDELSVVAPVVAAVESLLPPDREFDFALRRAMEFHGGHGCAGLVLGTRLALAGARALGVPVPDTKKRLIAIAETDRCAVDGIQAVTGCRPGKRTLRILDYGKLAATFLDERTGSAVRVASRGDLRERVGARGDDRHAVQRSAYAAWSDEDLFSISAVDFALSQFDRPGPPRNRVLCVGCREEVSDGRHLDSENGPLCRPCGQGSQGHSQGVVS